MNVNIKYLKDESGNIVSPVTSVNGIFTDKDSDSLNFYNLAPTGIAHNGIYRGKDITAFYDGTETYNGKTFHNCISDSTFDNIFIGDYITKTLTIDGVEYVDTAYVADIDTFYADVDYYSLVSTHHVVLWHIIATITHNMNSTNTTAGGYAGSAMHTYLTDIILPAIQDAFGSSYMLSHQKIYTTGINSTGYNRYGENGGCSNAWSWSTDQYISLLTEQQLGYTVGSSSIYDCGEAHKKLNLFNFYAIHKYSGTVWFWLRNIVSAARFCRMTGDGYASSGSASATNSVYPLTLCI